MILTYFGKITYADLRKFNNVEDKLKLYFANVEPSQREIYEYLDKFLLRYKLQLSDYQPGCHGLGPMPPNPPNN